MGKDQFINKVIIGIVIILMMILSVLLFVIYSDVRTDHSLVNKVEEKKVIKIWTIHGGIENIIKNVAKAYEEENKDIKIEITTFKNEVYQSTLQKAVMTNELPDIYFFWGYEKIRKYVDLDLIWDMSEAMEKYYDGEQPLPGAMEGMQYKGGTYGMPINRWCVSLFCNRKLFEEYDVAYPTTYETLLDAIQVFKENGVTPISSGSKEMWLNSLYYMSLVLNEGSIQGVYDASINPELLRAPQFYKAAKKMEQLIQLGPWEENYLESDAYDANYLFVQGEAAMLLSGSWVAANVEGEESTIKGQVDVIPFPGLSEGIGIGGYADTLVVSKQSPITQDEQLQKLYFDIIKEISRNAIEIGGIGLPAYEGQVISKEKFPTLYKCEQVAPNKGSHPAYDQIFSEELSDLYYELLSQVVDQKISAEEFIGQWASGVQN